MREKNHDIDLRAAAKGFDRGTAGVAGRRDDDGRAFAALLQHVIHQPRHKLHRQILEGERRPVKKLEHEQARIELGERRNGRMAKGAVGFTRHAREIGLAQFHRRQRGG